MNVYRRYKNIVVKFCMKVLYAKTNRFVSAEFGYPLFSLVEKPPIRYL